jgi:transcriptional regulator with XRE-family HTH domain
MTEPGTSMLVHKLRLQRGWSQEQLAEMSGVSVRTIQRLERGQSASVETLKAVAAVLEVDFTRLQEPDMESQTAAANVRADEAVALRHVRRLKDFYLHLIQFAVGAPVLLLLNLVVATKYHWALWIIAFWVLGLIGDGLRLFSKARIFTGAWERRQVERYLGRQL